MAEIRLLGAVEVWAGETEIDIGAAKQRLVLAALAAEPRKAVPIDVLADRVWGDRLPMRPSGALYQYVSMLRRALRPIGVGIVRRNGGYLLDVRDTAVDALRFQRQLSAAKEGDPEATADALRSTLALWRGVPLTGLDSSWAISYREGLTEARLAAWLQLAERMADAGALSEVSDDLVRIAREYPMSEPLAGFVIRALVEAGRRAEALRFFAMLRDRLIQELGEEPNEKLQALHTSVLRGDRVLTTPAATDTGHQVPRQLPAAPRGFVGRRTELSTLDDQLATAARAIAISTVVGSAGIGKTTLALHWAHQVKDRFPAGQLFVNLRGYDPTSPPTEPAEALRTCLEAIGTPSEQVPADLEARAAMFRSLTAERPLLVILDNARDSAQVRPLIPTASGCAVVITSRDRLTGVVAQFGARPILLDLLSTADARSLLVERIGSRRADSAPAAVTTLAKQCANLPLALSVLAAHTAMQPGKSLAELARQLTADDRTRLDRFDTADPATSVRAVFSCSYDALEPDPRRLFRLLGLHPGPDISVPLAASLLGADRAGTEAALRRLCRASLLTEHVPDRYACHDLLRSFAAEAAQADESADERDAAVRRLLDHYLHTAYQAIGLLNPGRDELNLGRAHPGAQPEYLADVDAALAWFAIELPGIRSSIEAESTAWHTAGRWRLADLTARFLGRQGRWHDAISVGQIGVVAAERTGDSSAVAMTHRGLAYFHTRTGRFDEARRHSRRSLDLYRSNDDPVGLARALEIAAFGPAERQDFSTAIRYTENALKLFATQADQIGQLRCLGSIGWFRAQLGELGPAGDCISEALRLAEELGDLKSLAAAHHTFGYLRHREHRYAAAIRSYEQAEQVYRRVGDRYYVAIALQSIGDVRSDAGDAHAARAAWEDALDIFDELGHARAGVLRDRIAAQDVQGSV